MPRNSSGTYALPAGNPVAPNTLIETAWANPTMADLGTALTDSLDRFGRGSMLAPLKLIDGTVAAPALAFNGEATSGLYRVGPGNIGVSIAGTERARISSAGVNVFGGLTTVNDISAGGNISSTGSLSGATGSITGALTAGASTLASLTVTANAGVGGNLVVTGTTGMNGQATITRLGAVSTNSFLNWTDSANSTGYLSVRPSGVGIGSDGYLDFSTGQNGISNAFNQRVRFASNGQVIMGGTSPNDAFSVLSLIGPSGSAQLSISNGGSLSFFGGGTSTVSVFGTGSNVPIDLYVNSAPTQRWDTSGNAGLGTQTISTFGHGGTNRIFQVNNSGTAVNSQGQLIVSSAFTGSGVSALGTLSFATTAAGTGGTARVAHVGGVTDTGHTSGTPAGALELATKGTGDATAQTRARIDSAGTFTYGGLEIGYRDVPRVTGGLERGKCFATSVGVTVNTGATGNIFSIYNDSGSPITLTQGGGVTLRLGGTTSTGNRTLAARGLATVWYNGSGEAIAMGPGLS